MVIGHIGAVDGQECFFGGVVLLALGGFMHLESRRAHLILLSAVGDPKASSADLFLALGLLLFVVNWLDHPFWNQWASLQNRSRNHWAGSTPSNGHLISDA